MRGQVLPCPNCGDPIAFDTYEMLKGVKFQCAKCAATIGISKGSMGKVKEAMDKLEQVKRSGLQPGRRS